MRDFQKKYREKVDQLQVPGKLAESTKKAMERHTGRSRVRWSVLIPVCALIAAGSITAAAYGINGGLQSRFQPHVNNVPEEAAQDIVNMVGKQTADTQLTVIVEKTVMDSKMMYIHIEMQTNDGSPLQEFSQFRQSERGSFSEAVFNLDGQEYRLDLLRMDNGTALDQASFEGVVFGDFSQADGKQASIRLKNFKDEVVTCEGVDSPFENLKQLYDSMTPEASENFIETGAYCVHGERYDPEKDPSSWTLPAGDQHIAFSSQFPKSYIDNIGFHKNGETQHDMLYISITPGSEEEAAELKKLCFQNIDTNMAVPFYESSLYGMGVEPPSNDFKERLDADWARKRELDGGRIVLVLDPCLSRDMTAEDLASYRFARNFDREEIIRAEGEWEVEFPIAFTDTMRTIPVNQTISAHGYDFLIREISISDLNYSIVVSSDAYRPFQPTDPMKTIFLNDMQLIMKDGSKVFVGYKIGTQQVETEENTKRIDAFLATIVDAGQVVAVEIFGQRVDLPE